MGLAAGALAGILLAPKSGEETREFLAKKTKGCMKKCQNAADKCCKAATEYLVKEESVAKKAIKNVADNVSEKMN